METLCKSSPRMRTLQCLRRWKPLIELILTILVLIVAVCAAVIAWRSDATFKDEARLLSEAKALVEQENTTFKQEAQLLGGVKALAEQENATFKQGVAILETTKGLIRETNGLLGKTKELWDREAVHKARDDFDMALDEADRYCQGPRCSPTYAIFIPLDKAVRREQEAAQFLTAAEYNRLALVGSTVWDFGISEQYVKKALDKKDKTPVDIFVSHLVLGHLNFVFLKADPDHANLKAARAHFDQAIKALPEHSGVDAIRAYVALGFEFWAAHEAFLKNNEESKQLAKMAVASRSGLSDPDDFERQLNATLDSANRGVMPQIGCLFKPPTACGCTGPCKPILAPAAPAAPAESVPPR